MLSAGMPLTSGRTDMEEPPYTIAAEKKFAMPPANGWKKGSDLPMGLSESVAEIIAQNA